MRPLACGLLMTAAACAGSVTDPRTAPAGAAPCAAGTSLMSVFPVALTDFVGWVPLGALNPVAHVFPTDHQYIYINDPGSAAPRREVPLMSPADMVITFAKKQTVEPGSVTDYSLSFSLCKEVAAEFGHVLTIDPALLQKIGSFNQNCSSYSPSPGSTVSVCEAHPDAVSLKAGQPIGTAGGPSPHSFGLDVSMWDTRVSPGVYVNPQRWTTSSTGFDHFHIVAASDYFTEPLRSQVAARIGSFNGKVRRTAQPLGGTIAVDVANSAMGHWFNPSQPTYPEYTHLAIAPDNVTPTDVQFSFGTSQPNWTRGLVTITPAQSGRVNRDPSQVTADGNIYCYEGLGPWVLLVQLTNATTLKVESSTASSCASAQPWTFSAAAFSYVR